MPSGHAGAARVSLAPLFLVSGAAVGFEISLTRYFAVANWSEYGYWVISITMVGFAASGVILSLFSAAFERHAGLLLFAVPPALIVAATAGYGFTTAIPFNPLELQNPDLWAAQLANIGKYYLALFPFYFLAGLYVGLYFLTGQDDIPRVYGADLLGAGTGSIAVLAAMHWLHPFDLAAALLPLLAVAALYHRPASLARSAGAWKHGLAVLALLGLCEAVLLTQVRADFNEYKAIYPPLHVEGGRVVEEERSPRGLFITLENFTERLDTDFSNNFGSLGVPPPPSTLGFYGDGNRLTSLPKPTPVDPAYARGALDALPYELRPGARTLLVGSRGGFRIEEALHLGARDVTAIESLETLHRRVAAQAERPGSALRRPEVRLVSGALPAALVPLGPGYDLIDIASDHQGQGEANKFAFTAETVGAYLRALGPEGIVSIPMSIREFTAYALKMVETARAALAAEGVAEPHRHLLVYRSNWNVRILVARRAFTAEEIRLSLAFADLRSFDASYYPGVDPATARVWNDLPAVSLESGVITSSPDRPSDALMDEILQLLGPGREAYLRASFFDVEAATNDRPFVSSALPPRRIGTALERVSLLPREEIGLLINFAVLLQAIAVALAVMLLPFARWRREQIGDESVARTLLYFAGLGLGFLFVEIYLIEKASYYLGDRTYAFSVVLAGMLVFSGLGSQYCGRYQDRPARGLAVAAAIVLPWIAAAMLALDALLLATIGLPDAAKMALLLAILAPLSFALGFPFSLGLAHFRGPRHHFLPWAWSLNGAFSVVATPLATLVALAAGYRALLGLALALYVLVFLTFPSTRPGRRAP